MNSIKNRLPRQGAGGRGRGRAHAQRLRRRRRQRGPSSRHGTVKVAVFPSFNALGAHAADLEGTFEEQGLDVEFVTVATPAEATPAAARRQGRLRADGRHHPGHRPQRGRPGRHGRPGCHRHRAQRRTAWASATSGSPRTARSSPSRTSRTPPSASRRPRARSGSTSAPSSTRPAATPRRSSSSRCPTPSPPSSRGSVDVVTTAEPAGTAALADPDLKLLSGFVSGGEGEVAYTYVTTEKFAQSNARDRREVRARRSSTRTSCSTPTEGLPAKIAATYVDAPAELLEKARLPEVRRGADRRRDRRGRHRARAALRPDRRGRRPRRRRPARRRLTWLRP